MTSTLPDTTKLCSQGGWEDVATINRMAAGSTEWGWEMLEQSIGWQLVQQSVVGMMLQK